MAGPVDYLQVHSYDYVRPVPTVNPNVDPGIVDVAPVIKWHFISHDMNPVNASSGPALIPTTTYDKAPRLDYLLVPGPDPFMVLSDETVGFVRRVWSDKRWAVKGLMTVCSGSMVLAQTGVLDGYRVASNKVALGVAKRNGVLYDKVKWVGDRRWVVDGRVWSAAGVTAGIDLAAEFLRRELGEGRRARGLRVLARNLTEYESNPDRPDPFAGILEGVELNG
ncbi:hypothetical protein CVT24_003462 [Panaeolus cyanescens]|uniref:DJ-1/PfpI domain-containing protein n=1 Tax=Panaeolus cyanescens TaxID=181874 RepID=A0A409Y7E8_9AGAR|nr:hypothetical protein CVT24_003462 [Panaeolus cyanescens]